MSWFDTVKSWFTPEPEPFAYEPYSVIGPEPEPEPFAYEPYSVIGPEPEPFAYEPYSVIGPEPDSLWDKFKSGFKTVYQEAKEIAPDVGSFYAQIQGIKKSFDTTSLVTRQPAPMEIPRTDFVLNTSYQRPTSGTQPGAKVAVPSLKAGVPSVKPGAPGAQIGLSMPLILLGAGLIFLMLRKR